VTPKNIEVINTEIEELEQYGIKQPGEKDRQVKYLNFGY
jgi:hypothetical protein